MYVLSTLCIHSAEPHAWYDKGTVRRYIDYRGNEEGGKKRIRQKNGRRGAEVEEYTHRSKLHTKIRVRGYPVGAGTYSAGTDTTVTADTAAAGTQMNKPLEDAIDCGAVEPGWDVLSSKERFTKVQAISGVRCASIPIRLSWTPSTTTTGFFGDKRMYLAALQRL